MLLLGSPTAEGRSPAKLRLRPLKRGRCWHFQGFIIRLFLEVWKEPGHWTSALQSKCHYLGNPDRNSKQTGISKSLIPPRCLPVSLDSLLLTKPDCSWQRSNVVYSPIPHSREEKSGFGAESGTAFRGLCDPTPAYLSSLIPSISPIIYSIPITLGFFPFPSTASSHLQAFTIALPST